MLKCLYKIFSLKLDFLYTISNGIKVFQNESFFMLRFFSLIITALDITLTLYSSKYLINLEGTPATTVLS